MAEKYIGVKFRTEFLERWVPTHKKCIDLMKWCKKLHCDGFMPDYEKGSSGNLSFRTKNNRFIITGTATFSSTISNEDLVEVVNVDLDNKILQVIGLKEPSSESLMHYLIYKNKPEVKAVFHAHWDKILNKAAELGIPITEIEISYGTKRLGLAVVDKLRENDFIVMKNHGFVSVGENMQEAGENIYLIKEKLN